MKKIILFVLCLLSDFLMAQNEHIWLIKPHFDDIYYNQIGFYTAINNDKTNEQTIIFDKKGNEIIKVKYGMINFISELKDKEIKVKYFNCVTKEANEFINTLVDTTNQTIFKSNQYTIINEVKNKIFLAQNKKQLVGIIDLNEKIIIPFEYIYCINIVEGGENYFYFCDNKKVSKFDYHFRLIKIFDEYRNIQRLSTKVFALNLINDKKIICNEFLEPIVKDTFDVITPHSIIKDTSFITYNTFIVEKQNLKGIMDSTGKYMSPLQSYVLIEKNITLNNDSIISHYQLPNKKYFIYQEIKGKFNQYYLVDNNKKKILRQKFTEFISQRDIVGLKQKNDWFLWHYEKKKLVALPKNIRIVGTYQNDALIVDEYPKKLQKTKKGVLKINFN